jgi:hypothetical protein
MGRGTVGNLWGMEMIEPTHLQNTDPAIISQVLTENYNMLEEWIMNNKLVINPDKTQMMVMGGQESSTTQAAGHHEGR